MTTTVGQDYVLGGGYDEYVRRDGTLRPEIDPLWRHLRAIGLPALREHQEAAEREIRAIGVTFGVDGRETPTARSWPLDLLPRIVVASEWKWIEAGLIQRLQALNCFIDDCYHEQRAVRAGVVPAELVLNSPNFRPECVGARPVGAVWAHICGSDLVRDADGTIYVLEDNLRVPSGVSYMIENRMVAKRIFPELFSSYSIEPVDPYLSHLGALLSSVSAPVDQPTVVVLTPGTYNAGYFEHAFLAQQLGVELVTGDDLVVLDDDTVAMKTIDGLQRVDVVYRRVDDLHLDPEVFRRDSKVGVPGLVRAWRAGRVAIVNAPGAGVADDKAVYAFVPELIRLFLDEEPILHNVPTYRCGDPDERRFVLEHLEELVVKPANESGGYGIVIGGRAGPGALELVQRRIESHPAGWVAQPTLALSMVPTLCAGELAPRHVDLRPFVLLGPGGSYVTKGGLTRVAREEGSLIVNSSQGGGSKDTWVVDAATIPGAEPAFVSLGAPTGAPVERAAPAKPTFALGHAL
ncbi:MAG TPA: circularly permuted type 2 ATP-grasp protein [Acidimicrobiales bacterium]|nr:circularly permuted type 2 ATP-grasp protein [Acidimicrobiales bacterium]